MKILWICPFVPYPPDNGGSIRVFSMLEIFAKQHAITLVCLRDPLQGGTDVQPLCDLGIQVHVLDAPPFFPFKLHHLPHFFSRMPGSLVIGTDRLRRQLSAIAVEQPFDLLHVEFLALAELAMQLDIKHRTVTEHFLAVESYRHNLKGMHGLRQWYFQRELSKLERWEPDILGRFDQVFVTSEPHLQRVSEWIGTEKVTLVPNGVDIDYFQPQANGLDAQTFVFMGAFYLDAANQRALAVLLDTVFPEIQRRLPNAVLHVIGKGVPPALQNSASEHIRFHGYVDDVRPILASSAALLLPIIGGSGTKLRVLTAMAMGKVVVSTVDGLAGLACEPGRDVLVGADWEGIASLAVQAATDGTLRTRIGARARQTAQHYSWQRVSHEQAYAWEQLLKGA